MAKTINLGKVGVTLGGDYDSSKNYASRTCVFYNHVSWTSKKDVPAGIAPGTNDEYWQKVSERGAQGIQGERGPQGNSAFDGTGIELVNNLTQGGEASALSAEQGKILKTELTELESSVGAEYIAKYDKGILVNSGYIDLSGKITLSNKYGYSDYIKVLPGQQITAYVQQSASICGVSFYNSQYEFVEGYNGEAYAYTKLEKIIEDNICYIRFCHVLDDNSFSATLSKSGIYKLIDSQFDSKLEPVHYVTLLGSARFGKVSTDEKPTAPVFIDGQYKLVNQTIVGMKVSVSKGGTIVLCKCSNYLKDSPSFENLQSYDVDEGENYLILDIPIKLGANEAIGVSPNSTASYHRGGYDSDYNKGYYYYNDNQWSRSGADLVMAILTDEIELNMNAVKDDDKMWMSSSKYFYDKNNTTDQATYPVLLNGQHKGIVSGVKISIEKRGVIVLSLAKGTNGNTPSFTELQRFDVIEGVNYLQFDNPITLEENWGIVVAPPSTATYHRPAVENIDDVGAQYFNGKAWLPINGIVMAIYIDDLSDVYKRLGKTEEVSLASKNTIDKIVDPVHYTTLLGSARFGKVSTDEKPTAPVFIDGQQNFKGQTIVGMKVSVSKGGTIVLCKCSNYLKDSPSFENLQSYDVDEGENYLILDIPIKLGANEAIGVSPNSTASYHRGGYDSDYNKGYYYYNNNQWSRSGADLVMAILTDDSRDINVVKDFTLRSVVYPIAPPALYSHLFIDNIYIQSNPTIPSQSVFDVALAAMLGFKMIELNVNYTSDGIPVTGHPVNGRLQFLTDLKGNTKEIDVRAITFAELRDNYRYKSTYPQFRTPISTLEECLRECQKYDITPFVQCVTQSVIDLTEKIVGKRYVAYGASRSQTNAVICEFHGSGTIDELVSRCKEVGSPYILGVSSTLLDIWTDEEIKELLSRVHAEGCWVNWAACYHTPDSNARMRKLGLDSAASGWDVPIFSEYDKKVIGNSVVGFDNFVGEYSIVDGVAKLASQGYLQKYYDKLGIISKAQLYINFKGRLGISFGKINSVFESDGSDIMHLSSVVENAESGIYIYSYEDSEIYSIDYRVITIL